MMRRMLRPMAGHLKWPMRIGVFVAHFMHQTAAFFAWVWMSVHVVGTVAQAGLQANRLWEMRVLDDIWRDGIAYFATAGGSGWQTTLGIALIPAVLVALERLSLLRAVPRMGARSSAP
jgi:hypothetical protein